ncbi:MAG: 50S ribosomal protein L25/general stress protein Ctc [Alphaproteobacteria bacterium]
MTKENTKKAGLEAFSRDKNGKGAARSLRRDGKVPAVLYSKNSAPVSIAVKSNELRQEYMRGRFRSRLIELSLDGKVVKALPKDVQFHPVSDQIEHVDFIKIESGVAVNVQIPVKFIGTEKSVGLKKGGVLNIVRHEIEFHCLPEAIVAHIEINIEQMDIGDSVHINDVTLPAGITPVIKRNFTIATVAGRSASMEEEAKPVAAAADGAAPAAGAAAPAADAKAADAKKDEKK